MSNKIIKQYYGIIKTFKILIVVKIKKGLTELMFLFRADLSYLMSKFSLISRTYSWCLYAKMVKSWKDGILLQIRKQSRIACFFDDLTFLNVTGDVSICSPDLTFKCLSVSP